jgi:hypothetical protein
LAELRQQRYSSADLTKLAALSASFSEQLAEYGLTSIPVNEIDISQTTLRPSHEGFDLSFDLSASDAVRTKWAYLVAFLETARAYETNHPGLLILDEPRQQSTSEISFATLLKRLSNAEEAGQQVIFATSEQLSALKEMLVDTPHQMIAFEDERPLRLLLN